MSNSKESAIEDDLYLLKNFTPENFKQFVLNNICQCESNCEKATGNIKGAAKENKDINCSQINVQENLPTYYKNKNVTKLNLEGIDENRLIILSDYYRYLYENAIQVFVDNDILIKKRTDTKFYILKNNEKRKLTWENIKSHESLETRQLLWLFRKLIVDTLIKYIITKYNLTDLIIYSVGSNDLTSDYDITLYGSNTSKVNMIKQFDSLFNHIFGNKSSLVFDTNIYGKAYIEFKNPNNTFLFTQKTCGKENFYYLNDNIIQRFEYSTIIWALIKFFREIREAFGEDIYNKIYIFMRNKQEKKQNTNVKTTIYQIVNDTLLYLRNQDETKVKYELIIENEELYKNQYINYYKNQYKEYHMLAYGKKEFENQQYLPFTNDDKIHFENDNISLINFFGEETYFTRGAFLDTVVNSQICSNKNIIKLNEKDYITSIIENASFFFIHNNKTKYLQRVIKSFKILSNYGHNVDYKDLYNSYEFNYMNNIITKEEHTKNIKDIKDFISNLKKNSMNDMNNGFEELKTKIDKFVQSLQAKKVIDIDNKYNKENFDINKIKPINTSSIEKQLNNIKEKIIPQVTTLTRLDQLYKIEDILNNINEPLLNYKYCTMVSEDSFNLLDCEKYSINQCLLWFIYKLTINIQKGEITFPFYDIYILQNNSLYDLKIKKQNKNTIIRTETTKFRKNDSTQASSESLNENSSKGSSNMLS
jgi:hypothetical protein